MKRIVAVVLGLGIVGIGSARAWKAHRPPKTEALGVGLYPIKVPSRKNCSVTPYAIADRLGFLAAEGLRIQWTGETQPALLIPSIVRGDNDVSDFPPNTLAVAKAGGAPLTGVAEAGIEPTDPALDPKYRHAWWFINPAKLPNATSIGEVGRAIVDRKIIFTTSTPTIGGIDFEGKLLAKKYGIPLERIEWVTMPDVQAIEALKLGLVDVAGVHGHFYSGMQESGARKIADSSETGLGPAAGITYWAFRDEFIKEHPDKAAAWARALQRAQAWANANPEAARKLTEEAIGLPVTGSQYYSESRGVDGELAARWLEDLVQSEIIAPGRVTTKTIVTQQIAALNESVYANRDPAPPRP